MENGWHGGPPETKSTRPAPRLKILVVNVALDERPMAHKLIAASLIGADGFARIVVVFENGVVLEARV